MMRRSSTGSISTAGAFLLILGAIGCSEMPSAADSAADAHLAVEFAVPTPTASMSGLLHGFSGAAPADSLILPLGPRLWRVGNYQDYLRATAVGARVEVVLSDEWGYPSQRHGWPFENYSAWETYVREMVRRYGDAAVIWDVWHQPDIAIFWRGNEEQFRETYARASAVIRSELGPSAIIAGPSYAAYSSRAISGFLDYCRSTDCTVNVLSWQELGSDIPRIERNLQEIRLLTAEARYAGLGIRELHINSVVGESGSLSPAENIAAMYYLERGRADAATRMCWDNSLNENTCFNGSLGGLLSLHTLQPTGAWWALKEYAAGANSRVGSSTDNPLIVALASSNVAGRAQVLVANARASASAATATLRLNALNRLPWVKPGNAITVLQYRIPATAESPLAAPVLLNLTSYAGGKSSLTLELLDLQPHEVRLVVMRQ